VFLHRLHLNLRSREVRRDLADPYQMHATLCRAFSPVEEKCPAGAILWRLEPESGFDGSARILVQTNLEPSWERLLPRWLSHPPEHPVDLASRLALDALTPGQRFRFRLRANPSTSTAGKRIGLLQVEQQQAWLQRKGAEQHGFRIPRVQAFDAFTSTEAVPVPQVVISQEQMIRGRQQGGNLIQVFSVCFDGLLEVTEPARFREALSTGIGHGKALGLGLLSVVPAS